MAKPFYFWQTVSKKARFGLSKGQMATLESTPHLVDKRHAIAENHGKGVLN